MRANIDRIHNQPKALARNGWGLYIYKKSLDKPNFRAFQWNVVHG